MKNSKIILILFVCLGITIPYEGLFSQNSKMSDSGLIKSISDSVFAAIDKSVFSRSEELFYIGIDKNSLTFDYETVIAIQETSSKYVEIIDVKMNDKKISLNEINDEALYYTNYNLTFRVNTLTYHVANVRETGVLKFKNKKWEIIQQHASVPVTNDTWPAYLTKQSINSDPLYKFSVAALLEDFDLFTLALREAHAGLYNFITPQRYSLLTDSIKKAITYPMNEFEFYRLLSPIIEGIKCGHTRISLSNQTNDFLNKQNIFFPFKLEFISGKAYLLKDLSNTEIKSGSEILAINSRPIFDIVTDIFKVQNSDAGIITAKYNKLDEKFHELYCQFLEQSQNFTIQYIPYKTNKPKEITVSGINNNDWWSKANANILTVKKPLDLKVIKNQDIALLDIRKFVSQEINATHGSFQQYMDSAFTVIKEKNIQNLVIDLRGNGGGDIAQELIPYLIDKPIQYFKVIDAPQTRFSFLEYTDKGFFFNQVNVNLWKKYKNASGRYELSDNYKELIYPNEYIFKGNLFVLIDGNTFSGAAEICAILHDQKRATFFGEETGGSYHGSSSGDFLNVTLPHTQIKTVIPIRNYIINVSEDSNVGRGVIPDFSITNTIDDLLFGNDSEMKFVINYISKNR